jgi:alpha-amylase
VSFLLSRLIARSGAPEQELTRSYDIWDLGEFEQKGNKRTKWGTKEDLLKAIQTAADKGIITYIDAVMNHK